MYVCGLIRTCPFCGKLAFSAKETDGLSASCPHQLFAAFTGLEDPYDFVRTDIADKDGIGIHPGLLIDAGSDQADEDISLEDTIRRVSIPRSVCFELEEPFCLPMCANDDSLFLGFSEVVEFDLKAPDETAETESFSEDKTA